MKEESMFSEKEVMVMKALLESEIVTNENFADESACEIVGQYVSTLKGIESKLCVSDRSYQCI